MKVLVATEKPFAGAAVEGARKEVETTGNELALLRKYTGKSAGIICLHLCTAHTFQ